MRLKGKVAIVTGAQQGIGAAIARAFGREGANVVVHYLDDADAAGRVAESVRDSGGKSVTVQGDVAERGAIERIIAAAADLGPLGVMVNNAAIFPRVDFLGMSERDWDQMQTINLKGPFLGTQLAARVMIEHGIAGSIINFSSIAAFGGSPRGVHYVAAKAGVLGLTRAAALELAPHRIRVNAIAPGLVDTAQPRFGMTEEEINEVGRNVPLGRLAQPEDLAGTAVFLASDDAGHVTGQTFHVNGGQRLS